MKPEIMCEFVIGLLHGISWALGVKVICWTAEPERGTLLQSHENA